MSLAECIPTGDTVPCRRAQLTSCPRNGRDVILNALLNIKTQYILVVYEQSVLAEVTKQLSDQKIHLTETLYKKRWIVTCKDGMNLLSFSTTTTFLTCGFLRIDLVIAPGPGPTSRTVAPSFSSAERTILSK